MLHLPQGWFRVLKILRLCRSEYCGYPAELADTGFDASVIRFRARLADNGIEREVFHRLLERCKEADLVAAGGKQPTDSTHVISAVRGLNRLELAGESVRAALVSCAGNSIKI
ncbi:hypothetical protein ACWF95_41795 [Streptomyces vinaceus]